MQQGTAQQIRSGEGCPIAQLALAPVEQCELSPQLFSRTRAEPIEPKSEFGNLTENLSHLSNTNIQEYSGNTFVEEQYISLGTGKLIVHHRLETEVEV